MHQELNKRERKREEEMLSVLQWFIGLGSTVFLPIIIFILGIIFGVKPAKAAISGFTV